jgi:hypothetical protein
MIFGGLTFGLLLLTSVVGVNIVARVNHLTFMQVASMSALDFTRPELAGVVKGLLIANTVGLFILPPLVFSYLADPRPLAYVGLKPPQKNYFLLIGLVTIIAAYFAVEILGSLNESIVYLLPKSVQQWILKFETDANGQMKNILSMHNPTDLLMTVLLAGALPAIGEELFFRGIVQKLFIQICKSAWPGIIITGLLFSAFHMQFMGFIPRMALGVVLGSLYWFSGSIYTSMLGHFIFNSVSIFLIYFKVADLDSNTPVSKGYIIAGVAAIIIIIFLVRYLSKQSVTSYALEFPPVKEYDIFDEPDEEA